MNEGQDRCPECWSKIGSAQGSLHGPVRAILKALGEGEHSIPVRIVRRLEEALEEYEKAWFTEGCRI